MVDGLINFNQFEITTPIIKVIGVGGGGGNAVEYMYRPVSYTHLDVYKRQHVLCPCDCF